MPQTGLAAGAGARIKFAKIELRFYGYIERVCRGKRERKREKTIPRGAGWRKVREVCQLPRRGRCGGESPGRAENMEGFDSGGRAIMRRPDPRVKVVDEGSGGERVLSR